ncbi:MAG: HAD family hydrolase [Lachnospiraceae bacterium]|nr:HAD family hydrolase [Lachnospiraceae bacterium]
MIKAVLFDLDGTLLPMDMDEFTTGYFKFLVKKLLPHGYDKDTLIPAIWHGTGAMVKNDGSCTNEEAFWKDFKATMGEKVLKDKGLFEDFYANEFNNAREICGFNPKAAEIVRKIKESGLRVILATNPLFPKVATENRIRWAGLTPDEFEFFTTYENIEYCKPNIKYYEKVLEKAGLKPEDCIMVGNDVDEDMVASKLGMKVFLLTDCVINKSGKDIEEFPHGGFDEFRAYMEKIAG